MKRRYRRAVLGASRLARAFALPAVVSGALAARPGPAEGAAGEPEGPGIAGLAIEYEAKGVFPGGDARDEVRRIRQRVTVDDSGRRLELLELEPAKKAAGNEPAPPAYEVRRRLILRMDRDPPVIWDVLDGGKFREHDGDLNSLQRDRRIQEKNELEIVKRYPKKDRDAFFKEFWWLRPDGSREVTVERSPGATVLGRRCDRVRVLENGREIVDAQVAVEGPGARSYFHLYRRLGAFSEEVLEKIQGIPGIPLEGRITIVTALPTQTWEVEARSIDSVRLPPDFFDLPAGAVKVDEEPADPVCAWCKRRLGVPASRAPAKARLPDGTWIYFCSEE
ncbi:MAG: hypothetical protein ACUVYA_03355, partial [Planctomycetota bacterium]